METMTLKDALRTAMSTNADTSGVIATTHQPKEMGQPWAMEYLEEMPDVAVWTRDYVYLLIREDDIGFGLVSARRNPPAELEVEPDTFRI